jgi:IS30 family transposase
MSYTHFKPFQRNELAVLLRAGFKQNKIAELLGKTPAAVCQELQRNRTDNKSGYDVGLAKKMTEQRRLVANKRFKKIENNQWLRIYVIRNIKKYWSPEQISGRLKEKWLSDKSRQVSKDSIYKYIYGHQKKLVKYLRCQKGNYRRRYGTRIRLEQQLESKKKRITERPVEVETREKLGHWEGDTIVGSDKQHILTHVERKSGLLLADKLERGTAKLTRFKTIERFKNIAKKKKLSITYDNGTTFSEHELTERKTGINIYFAYPYHSWERGCNENCNGLLRQFFPKKSAFAIVTQKEIDRACNLINNRPRKRLGYLTPNEVFNGKKICQIN